MSLRNLALIAFLGLTAGCASEPKTHTPELNLSQMGHLTLTDIEGRRHDLDAELAGGKKVALIFWQSWCASCKSEAPAVVRASKAHAGTTSFIGVVPGPEGDVDEDAVRKAAKDWGLSYPTVRDTDLALTKGFEITGTPTIVILGPGKEVLYHGHHLPVEWQE